MGRTSGAQPASLARSSDWTRAGTRLRVIFPSLVANLIQGFPLTTSMQTSLLARLLTAAICVLGTLASCGETPEGAAPPSAQGANASTASQGAKPGLVPAVSTPTPAAPGAQLAFEQIVLDFGEVWDVANMVGSFPFRNTGDAALVFSDIKASCGCTSTKLDSMTYEPGAADEIDVVWDPKGFGQQSKTITVRSNSASGPIQVLTIRASIKPFAQFNGSAVQLGNLQRGEEHRQRLELTCVDPNFQLLELKASSPSVRVESLGPQANGSHGIEVIVDPSATWGMLNAAVTARLRGTLKDTGEQVEHEAEMRIQASIVHQLTVEPMLFAVGHVLPGRSFERVVRLEQLDGKPFQVTSAKMLRPVPASMQVEIEPYEISGKPGVLLRVKGLTGDYMGLISGQVSFETDIPGEGPHVLPVMGMIRN